MQLYRQREIHVNAPKMKNNRSKILPQAAVLSIMMINSNPVMNGQTGVGVTYLASYAQAWGNTLCRGPSPSSSSLNTWWFPICAESWHLSMALSPPGLFLCLSNWLQVQENHLNQVAEEQVFFLSVFLYLGPYARPNSICDYISKYFYLALENLQQCLNRLHGVPMGWKKVLWQYHYFLPPHSCLASVQSTMNAAYSSVGYAYRCLRPSRFGPTTASISKVVSLRVLEERSRVSPPFEKKLKMVYFEVYLEKSRTHTVVVSFTSRNTCLTSSTCIFSKNEESVKINLTLNCLWAIFSHKVPEICFVQVVKVLNRYGIFDC